MRKVLLVTFFVLSSIIIFAQDSGNTTYAADQSLLFMPTAYTMPKGTSALTDYEVLVLQYSYAATDHLHLSAVSVFPVTKDALRTLTVGMKQNFFRKGKVQSAGWFSFTPDSAIRAISFGDVVSYGTPERSAHAAVAFGSNLHDKISSAVLMGGVTTSMSERVNFIAEFTTTTEALKDNYTGLLSLGVRFNGKSTSWDLGGFRPLSGDSGDLLLVPYLKATFVF
ncbi:MAG TPA: hypothetical protein PLE74_01815 [Candidatus Cloacimonadota bacterium]|nr:hypothetical protein [Candidatus Cloacimonadota bacterium]HPT71002.1 hypothetical protein [Candidatus Cloacimonadota bacterium]